MLFVRFHMKLFLVMGNLQPGEVSSPQKNSMLWISMLKALVSCSSRLQPKTYKLRTVFQQSSFGESSVNQSDPNVRCYWQVDASKVTFPVAPTFLSNRVQALARKAVSALGLDTAGMQLEAHLSKLQFYEVGEHRGEHFTFHMDREKEQRLCASLILQLPTEDGYTGGKLVVKHKNKVKEFEHGHMHSAVGFCYTIFFADCLHEVREIKSGTMVCLAFSLVRCDSSFDSVDMRFTSDRLAKVEAALELWLEERSTGSQDDLGRILYIPLLNKYTKESLSFPGLKLEDSIAAELLKECKYKNGKQWLDVHLCMASRDKIPEGRGFSWYEFNVQTQNWIGSDGSKRPFKYSLGLDLSKVLVVGEEEDPFDSEPDEQGYRINTHTWAMLVAWPKGDSFKRACDASVSWALDILKKLHETGDSNFNIKLGQFISYCYLHAVKVWGRQSDDVTPRLLNLCTRAKVYQEVPPILDLFKCYSARKIGVRNAEVATAISDTVQVFGWELVSLPILKLVKECGSTQYTSFVILAGQLKRMGLTDAGALVANTASQALKARIGELESHHMPEFTWCQPLAKFPKNLEIEEFLKGPQEKYVHQDFPSLPNARSFCMEYFNNDHRWNASCGYSAVGTPGGRGCKAYCEIQKTRRLFNFTVDQWQNEQILMKVFKRLLRSSQLAVSDTNTVPRTGVGLESGHGDNKRQRQNP